MKEINQPILNIITKYINDKYNNNALDNFKDIKFISIYEVNPFVQSYRIPSISEFIDGFEYEIYSEGYFEDSVEDFGGWYKYTIGKDCWRDLEDIENELLKNNIRVKIK